MQTLCLTTCWDYIVGRRSDHASKNSLLRLDLSGHACLTCLQIDLYGHAWLMFLAMPDLFANRSVWPCLKQLTLWYIVYASLHMAHHNHHDTRHATRSCIAVYCPNTAQIGIVLSIAMVKKLGHTASRLCCWKKKTKVAKQTIPTNIQKQSLGSLWYIFVINWW
jgi:hypothetical protein